MRFAQLCLLEARNFKYRLAVLGIGILTFVYSQTPVMRLVDAPLPPALTQLYVFFFGLTAVYLFILFLGLTPIMEEKDNNVYDRVVVLPVAAWRVLFAKVVAIAGVSFRLGTGVVTFLAVNAAIDPLVYLGAVLVLAVIALGLTAGLVAVVLYVDRPRVIFFGAITVLGGLTQLPQYLVDWDISLSLAVAATIGLVVLIAFVGGVALVRVPAERVVLE